MALEDVIPEVLPEETKKQVFGPFFVRWALSFAAWNWHGLLILFYPMSQDLYARIEQMRFLYDGGWEYWGRLWIGPIVTAVFSLVVLPWFTNWLGQMRRYADNWDTNRRGEIDEMLTENKLQIAGLRAQLAITSDMLKANTEGMQEAKRDLEKIHTQFELEIDSIRKERERLVFLFPELSQALHRLNSSPPRDVNQPNVLQALETLRFTENGRITDAGRAVLKQLSANNA